MNKTRQSMRSYIAALAKDAQNKTGKQRLKAIKDLCALTILFEDATARASQRLRQMS